jgi:carboxyl-terminal processing protease
MNDRPESEKMKNTAYIRYTVAVVALMLGFAFSIRFSERGFLFDSTTSSALASAPETIEGYDLAALPTFNRVLLQLKDNYVEPERIDPSRMLVYTLDRVQNSVPEVVAIFNAELDAAPTSVEVRVGQNIQSFSIGDIESLWEMSFKLREVFEFVQSNIDRDEVDLRDVEYAAVNGMLSTLDPHSVLLTPEIYADMQADNQGHFGGLGIVISIRDGKLTVISPIDDTPAARAGFRAGDQIVKINDESTVNMPLDEAVGRLRGPPDTEVTVEVMRAGWTEPHSFNLRREVIAIESVSHEDLGEGIGYVQVRNFQGNTHDDLMEALATLEENGPLTGLVLDLRNNPGGLLAQAIAISDTFLSEGTIVTTVGIGDQLREENAATRHTTQGNYPIVVLVNPGSASASEIVAGALKNHDRAVIVGDTTFGKGSVQVLYAFPDGSALKLTIAQYLTPGDVSIQGVGIVPDIRMVPVSIDEDFIDLYAPEGILREGDLASALTSDFVEDADRPSTVVKYYFEQEEIDPEAIRDPDEFELDFQIDFARQVLLASGEASDRPTMLARANSVVDETAEEQLVQVQERLRNRNIDWSTGSNVIQPVTVETVMTPATGQVHVGDTVEFVVTVTNNGNRALHQVRAMSESDHALFNQRELIFGRIDPDQSASWTISVDVPIEEPTRYERVDFNAYADMIDLDAHSSAFIEVLGQPRPRWGFNYWIDDSAGNGDGLLQNGESIRFVMDVTNTGAGAADETTVYIRNHSEAHVFLNQGRDSIESLAAGETHHATFDFEVRDGDEEGNIAIEAAVFDSVFREFLSEELLVPVHEGPGESIEVRSGRAAPSGGPLRIHGGAADYTPVVAEMLEGSLPVTGYIDGFYRVEWDGGSGWVSENAAEIGDAVAIPPSPVMATIAFQPPSILLNTDVVRTDDANFQLTGTINDDHEVRDFYVVVSNFVDDHVRQSLKVGYEFVGQRTVELDEMIVLRPGPNQITLFARDSDKIVASEVLFVYLDE